jgi:hypothetical protein
MKKEGLQMIQKSELENALLASFKAALWQPNSTAHCGTR